MLARKTDKSLRTVLLTMVVALLAGLVASPRAGGQSPAPKAKPTAYARIEIPETPPHGWDPHVWSIFRDHCQEIANKAASHIPFNSADWSDAPSCGATYQPPAPPEGYSPANGHLIIASPNRATIDNLAVAARFASGPSSRSIWYAIRWCVRLRV